ncbi:hypothetical protein [uncultured Chryseobacterium sp.]|uniref:hypothetical protein n=1 Tax=uncultured Chryseobacterium sp. TaxID=259322 RepID=UPI0025D63126|nr:hypothetical protein [uncultured Chryseobacterium sp.]
MKNILYLPVKSSSLAFFFSKGIILPSIYYKNKPSDIQDKAENFILLSQKKWIFSCDCSLEIVLTNEEELNLEKIDSNFFKLEKPIPISRIKKIYFDDEKQKEITIWNINNGAGFVPEDIVEVDKILENEIYKEAFIFNASKNKENIDYERKVNRFDTALGGIAFMKAGASDNLEYPFNYFATLSLFNKLIEEQVKYASEYLGLSFSEKYKGLFRIDNNEWAKWQDYIYKDFGVKELENIAKSEGVKIQTKLGLVNLSLIDSNSFIFDLAVLSTYGIGKNKSVEDLLGFLQNVYPDKKEQLSLLFGLKTGYTKLRNSYKFSDKTINIKFKLNSQLDYYTIESIYQFCFNNVKENYSFEYIDTFCIKQKASEPKWFDSYKVLDKIIALPKKKEASEEFWNLYSDRICQPLIDYSRQMTQPFLKNYFDEKEVTTYFKELLKETITKCFSDFFKSSNSQVQISELINNYEREIYKLKNEILSITSSQQEIVANNEIIENKQSYLNSIDYKTFNFTELKSIAKLLNIPNYKKYKKDEMEELISLIKNNKTIL